MAHENGSEAVSREGIGRKQPSSSGNFGAFSAVNHLELEAGRYTAH